MSGKELVRGIIDKIGGGVSGVGLLLDRRGVPTTVWAIGVWKSRGVIPRLGKIRPDGVRPAYRDLLLEIARERGVELTATEVSYLRSILIDPCRVSELDSADRE